MDFIPYIGLIANVFEYFTDAPPATEAWTISAIATAGSFGAARAILMLSVWDDVVNATATKWDNVILKALRQILSVLAVKPGKKK